MRKITARTLEARIASYPTGTTIFCHNPKPLVSKLIRLGLNSFWDHSATLIVYNGVPHIVEAKGGEKIHPKKLTDWLRHRQDNLFGLSAARVEVARIESQYDKSYDYASVLFFMVIYQLTGLWLGRTGNRAMKSWFCLELSGWYREIPEWWRCVPKDYPKKRQALVVALQNPA